MNIVQEKTNDLSLIITINIDSADYKENVNKTFSQYRKNQIIKGFRKGQAPIGYIKKIYGREVLAKEIHDLISDSFTKYITDNKIETIGRPIEIENKGEYKWDGEESYTFSYELGLIPEFTIEFNKDIIFTKYKIKVNEDKVNRYILDLRIMHGKPFDINEAQSDNDTIYGELTQLNPNGSVMDSGIHIESAPILLKFIENEEIKKSLKGVKKGDSIEFDIPKAYKNKHYIAHLLKIKEEIALELQSKFLLNIKDIKGIEEASINEDFFNKVYPGEEIKEKALFEERIRKDISEKMDFRGEQKLLQDINFYSLEKYKFDLPYDYLKRLIKLSNPQITEKNTSEEFESFIKGMKISIIQDKTLRSNDVNITDDDVLNFTKYFLADYFSNNGIIYGYTEEQLNNYASNFLNHQERRGEMYEKVKTIKFIDTIKKLCTIKEEEISEDKFIELMK